MLGSNPAFMLLAPFVDLDLILDACDRYGVTLAYGPSATGGLSWGGIGGSAAIVFAPGHRIGFAGTGSGVVGSIYNAGVSVQVTLINGGPEKLTGDCLHGRRLGGDAGLVRHRYIRRADRRCIWYST